MRRFALVTFSAVCGSRMAAGRPARYLFDRSGRDAETPFCCSDKETGLSLENERVPQGGAIQRIAREELHLIRSRTLERAHSRVRSKFRKGT